MESRPKRKRAEISYAQEDEALEALLGLEEQRNEDTEEADLLEEVTDISYGKNKAPARKLAKLQRFKSVKKAGKPGRNDKPFPFMMLPAELRDYIYELALTDDITLISRTKGQRRIVARGPVYDDADRESDIRTYNWGWSRRRARDIARQQLHTRSQEGDYSRLVPNLLATCKQVHAEAVGYLYHQELIFEDMTAVFNFLAGIGSHSQFVTDVTVRAYAMGRGSGKAMNFAAFTMLAKCTNLRALYFECLINHYNWRPTVKNWLAGQIYRDGFHFLEAFGRANGAKDAAVDIMHFRDWEYDGERGNPKITGEQFEKQFRSSLSSLLGCKS